MTEHIVPFIMTILFAVNLSSATVWYVHPDSSLNSIAYALGLCTDDDTVLVSAGTYTEDIDWPHLQGIHLLSESGADTTIINGHLFIAWELDTTSVIRGFTIQNGYSTFGGGMYIVFGAPVITENIIRDNYAEYRGGGIYIVRCVPIIRNNVISGNTTGGWGGGLVCIDTSDAIITGNTISYNRADGNGGGIYCLESSPLIADNILTLNSASLTGGGINCWWSSPVIKGNTITRNITGGQGAGLFCWWSSPSIDSCSIAYNSGDGIYCEVNSSPQINYCNIVDNAGYGIYNNDSTLVIEAIYNWWGDPTGPYHPNSNPSGQGDRVSDYVVVRSNSGATIISGPLKQPKNRNITIYDVSGRIVRSDIYQPGIYFTRINAQTIQKIIIIR
jgi:hypothetical protein